MTELYRKLAEKASVSFLSKNLVTSNYAALPIVKEKTEVNGTINIIGDSLSDEGKKKGKYKQKIFGLIPYRWFLHQSPEDQFTNGRVWTYPLQLRMKHQLQEISDRNPFYNINDHSFGVNAAGRNMAEGGATAYNYRRLLSFFRYIKGFILSFFLNNIEKQSHDLKKEEKGIKPDDLNLIFAGANDLVTVGYCNEGGVSRAIKGVQTSIDLITETQKKTGSSNYSKNVVLFTLPDFSKTPRFHGETEEKRAQAKSMCMKFNEELKDLAESYRYIDFRFGAIYQVEKKEDINFLSKIKRQGIIVVGKGSHRAVYFVEKCAFVLQSTNEKPVVAKVTLSKAQQQMLGLERGKVKRNTENTMLLDEWICQLASQAKLDTDVKVFDAAAVFNAVDENPEMYGFTSGCNIYYRFDGQCDANIEGNAILLTKTATSEIEVSFFQQGELVKEDDGKARLVKLVLSTDIQEQLDWSLKHERKQQADGSFKWVKSKQDHGLLELLGSVEAQDQDKEQKPKQKHELWQTRIVQAAVKGYQDRFKQKIKLADIYTSILFQQKKCLPKQNRIFWDDLHPTAAVHFLIELVFGEFFNNHYKLQSPRQWLGDMAILQRKEDTAKLPFKYHEAPESRTLELNNKKAKRATFSQLGVAASGLAKKNDDGKPVRLLSAEKGYYRAYSPHHLFKATPNTEEKVSDGPKKVRFDC